MSKFINKYTHETAKEFVEQCGCEFLSNDYIGMNEKYEFKCSCGNKFETTFAKFQNRNKRQCNKCGRLNAQDYKKIKFNDLKKYISSFNCELMSNDYINSKSDISIKCKCGEIFNTTYEHYRNSKTHLCKKCAQKISNEAKMKYTYDFVDSLCKKNNCKLLFTKKSDYINRKSSLKIKCKCGNEYETKLFMLLDYNKFTCSECSFKNAPSSKGEYKIKNILSNNNIEFREQYQFENCKNIYVLRFDFAILENGNLKFLIEYDGKQHYESYEYYGGEKTFNEIKLRDKIKDDYCEQNNIILYRIAYYDYDNLDEIILNILNENNLHKN